MASSLVVIDRRAEFLIEQWAWRFEWKLLLRGSPAYGTVEYVLYWRLLMMAESGQSEQEVLRRTRLPATMTYHFPYAKSSRQHIQWKTATAPVVRIS